jgi:hypothetical protein
VKLDVTFDIDVHPLSVESTVSAKLIHLIRRNLSVGDAAWFTFEADEASGKLGTMFRIHAVKVKP